MNSFDRYTNPVYFFIKTFSREMLCDIIRPLIAHRHIELPNNRTLLLKCEPRHV